MKIGEALVMARLVTEEQLKSALERQKVFGSRIDTSIVESGFLDDEKLTRFLGQFLKLPAVTSNLVDSIPDDVINTMKKDVAEKYGTLPFKKEGTRLHVAMLNPKKLKDIEDLRFMTGFDIIPYVITELKLRKALEKYYGIKKKLHHITMNSLDAGNQSFEIERSESIYRQEAAKKAADESSQDDIRRRILIEEKDPGKSTELVGALLSNAFFTAKLFYEMKQINLTDNQIEDEVLRNWARFQKKITLI